MLKGLYTAYTGMLNEQNRMDVMTNNLANSATIGYKKEGSTSQSFSDVLAYKIKDTSESVNLAKKVGTNNPGVKIGENYTDYTQGAFKSTGNTYDLALSGDGFFSIEFTNKSDETSTKYTRDGSFTLNNEGYMVTADGDFVLGEKGKIKLDPLKDSSIDETGTIFQNNVAVDQLKLTDFEDYNYLQHYGENLYEPVEGAVIQDANIKVFSGYLEASNVQVVQEMVDMISITRAYESSQKVIKTYDASLEIAVNQLGKL